MTPDRFPDLAPGRRVLLGPGPSEVPARVLKAMATPLLGHLDPEFLDIMDRVQQMLREVYRTANRLTLPLSGTGGIGMETCFANLAEPGETAVIGVKGVFGQRMVEIAERAGARVVKVEAPWGEIIPESRMIEAISRERPKIVGIVHAETTTGVLQPVAEVGRAAREAGALFVLDCVTSLAGCPVDIDAWNVDAAYSGTQKCLSCPPGLSPATFSDRALEAVKRRKRKVQSWYMDLSVLAQYWGQERAYHHTAPISMNFAIYEALRAVLEEGLEARFARHRRNHEALAAGIAAMGLSFSSQEGHRLPMLNAIRVPDGIDELKVRRRLLADHAIEIGGGMGLLKGKIWRIGLMGESSHPNNVVLVLAALERAIRDEGGKVGNGAAAALDYYRAATGATRP